MQIRTFDATRDREAVHRIWRDVGWVSKGKEEIVDKTLAAGRALVAETDSGVECLVSSTPGTMRYLREDLPMAEYTAVATSHLGRRQGLATRTLARTIAADTAAGSLLGRLCVFDQGFYDQVGFGTGSYTHRVAFDPASLRVDVKPRVPRRLGREDAALLHASRLSRMRGHGTTSYPAPEITEVEVLWSDDRFGFGYCDGPNGELTHHLWLTGYGSENGPYWVQWMTYQTHAQLLELLGFLRTLGDQVDLIRMREPQGIQIQDLLDRPSRHRRVTRRSSFENDMSAHAYWQVRICDLAGCLARTHLPWGEVRFNLQLADPIARYLDDDAPWRGLSGDSIVTLGATSGADPGSDPNLPTLTASINAFSRLWLGVQPATGLAVTDDLHGPESLLEALDATLRLPTPMSDWDF